MFDLFNAFPFSYYFSFFINGIELKRGARTRSLQVVEPRDLACHL